MAYKQRPSLLGALLWLGLGVLFLLDNFGIGPDIRSLITHYWPVLLILLGAATILDHFFPKEAIAVRFGEAIGIIFLIIICMSITITHDARFNGMFRNFQFHLSNQTPWQLGPLFGSRTFTETNSYPAEKGQPISIENAYGSVTVLSGRDNEISVRLKKVIYADDARAQSIADEIHLQGAVDGQTSRKASFVIKTNRESLNSKNYRFSTDFEITVPRNSQVKIINSYGNMRVSEIDGNININATQGNLEVWNCSGEFEIYTRFASTRLRNLTGKAQVNARGKVFAENIHGDIQVTNEFSPIDLRNIDGKVLVSSNSGNLKLDNMAKSADISVQGAQVKIRGLKESLKVNADYSNLDLRDIGSGIQLASRYSTIQLRDIQGDITLDSNSDNITAKILRGNFKLRARGTGIRLTDLRGNADIQTSLQDIFIKGLEGDCVATNEYAGIHISAQKLLKLIQAKNHSGSIDLFIPESAPFSIIATALNGEVKTNYHGLPPAVRESTSMVLRSPIRNGDPKILLDTDYGNIRISHSSGPKD
jgi:DUF4097 and DUF4098 domain-containing protein YvlB